MKKNIAVGIVALIAPQVSIAQSCAISIGNCCVANEGQFGVPVPREPSSYQACVDQLNSTLSQQAEALSSPFVELATSNPLTSIGQCIGDEGLNLSAEIEAISTNPISSIGASFSEVMASNQIVIENLFSDLNSGIVAGGDMPDPADAIEQSRMLLFEAAKNNPISSCIWGEIEADLPDISTQAISTFAATESSYQTLSNNVVVPLASSATDRIIADVISSKLPTAFSSELKNVALGVAAKYYFNARNIVEARQVLQTLNDNLVAPRPSAIQLDRRLSELKEVVETISDLERELPLEIAIEIIRYVGHDVIDTHGPRLINEFMAINLTSNKDAASNLIDAISALACTPPNAATESVTLLTQIGINLLDSGLRQSILSAVKATFDLTVDTAHLALSNSQPPSSFINSPGVMPEVLQQFPTELELITMVIPELDQIRNAMSGYHQAVIDLAEQSVEQITNPNGPVRPNPVPVRPTP